jgi:hypothetical protein
MLKFPNSFIACILILLGSCFGCLNNYAQEMPHGSINRKAVVQRHNLKLTNLEELGPTQVGNGEFAYGFDLTGMQTFNDQFITMSNWGWHSTKPPANPKSFERPEKDTHGRSVTYDLPNENQPELSAWLAKNPHKFNLARIGLWLKEKGTANITKEDIGNAMQHFDFWTGVAESNFTLAGFPVKVITVGDPSKDVVGFRIESPLISQGKLGVSITFPYASLAYFSSGSDYDKPDLHETRYTKSRSNAVTFERKLDTTLYYVSCTWSGKGSVIKQDEHRYVLNASNNKNAVEYVFSFSPVKNNVPTPAFIKVKANSLAYWPSFWQSGGAIDLSKSTDKRWSELERRIVLSQYIMKINATGYYPPQETGLVNNSWYGRFHYEMIWWHEAHFALWDRWTLLNNSLHVYQDNLASSIERAKRQGYAGARFPKCTGPDGREWPDRTHAFLVWQQPHPIFFAELDYRAHPTKSTLLKWKDVVENSADFLASYAYFDSTRSQYILGPPIASVPENNDSYKDQNPTFELAYWRYGLKTAQKLRTALGLAEKPKWNTVFTELTPLPIKDGLYEQWENVDSMWTKFNFEHPALLGVFGMLPGYGVDTAVMEKTYQKVQSVWRYDTGWGWDFPMVAMTAARLGHRADAVNMLLHSSPKNGFDAHGFVGGGNPYPYIPTNGALLYAVAMMCAGWDGAPSDTQPGFPNDGSWVVQWEGLKKAP